MIDPRDYRRPQPTPEEGRKGFFIAAAVIALTVVLLWWSGG